MKRLKTALSLLIVSTLLFSVPTSFATTKTLTLEDAITLSKENSATIRGIENQDFSTQNTIRQNIQNSYQLSGTLDTYYDYIELYNTVVDADHTVSGVHPYYKYIGKSADYLTTQIGHLSLQIAKSTNSTEVKALSSESGFIQLYLAFGDNPSLTKESKYDNFLKNEAMLLNSVDLINTQYEQGLQSAIKGTEAGVISLYVAIKDLAQAVTIQEDMFEVSKEGLDNMKTSYGQGLVSKKDYDNQIMTTEIARLDFENLKYKYENVLYQMKNMCGLSMDTNLVLTTTFNNYDYTFNTPSMYYENAYNSNMDYINLQVNLTYNEKNFAIMNKYLDDYEDDVEFTKPIYYQEKIDQQDDIDDLNDEIDNKKQVIESNVQAALNDLSLMKKQIEHNDTALQLATDTLNNGIQSFKLGQITQLQLDQLKLQYAGSVMTADQNVRAYNTGIEQFKLLIDYGVTYNTGQ